MTFGKVICGKKNLSLGLEIRLLIGKVPQRGSITLNPKKVSTS